MIIRKMFCLDFRVLCIFFSISVLITDTFGAVNQNSSGARTSPIKQTKSAYSGLVDANGGYYSKNKANGLQPSAPASTAQNGGSSRGLGLSAWGIIGLVTTAIVGGIAAYYVALFYPIVCKKQGKYDIMELTPV